MNRDLTKGSVLKSMLLFSIPMILGDLLQLWFSEKWSDDAVQSHRIEDYLAAQDVKGYASKHVYIFAITGNAVLIMVVSRPCIKKPMDTRNTNGKNSGCNF